MKPKACSKKRKTSAHKRGKKCVLNDIKRSDCDHMSNDATTNMVKKNLTTPATQTPTQSATHTHNSTSSFHLPFDHAPHLRLRLHKARDTLKQNHTSVHISATAAFGRCVLQVKGAGGGCCSPAPVHSPSIVPCSCRRCCVPNGGRC